jgi:hypothetical protein
MARPKLYENAAARQAAYRERNATTDVRLTPERLAKLTEIAEQLDVPRTELINSMLAFALANRNWRLEGLYGKRLPQASAPEARRTSAESAPVTE